MKIKSLLAVLLMLSTLAGCTKVDYSVTPDNSNQEQTESTTELQDNAPPANILTENLAQEHKINPVQFKKTLEAETLLEKRDTAEGESDDRILKEVEGFSGEGYIELKAYQSLTFEIDAVSSQHYNIEIYACGDGGAATLTVGGTKYIDSENGKYKVLDGETHGTYKVAQSRHFLPCSVAPAYIKNGKVKITIQAVNGSILLDKLVITNADVSGNTRYSEAQSYLSGEGINYSRISLMQYLNSIYGNKTLLAQYVTPGTDAEIDVIYKHTGRYPAIRCSDLMYYTEAGYKVAGNPEDDISLAVNWGEKGGIVSYSWYWYAPSGKATFYKSESDFDISQIITDAKSVAVLNNEELQLLLQDEGISDECYKVLCDMDSIAEQLKILKEKNIAVLFKPLACTDAKMYWWEADEEVYKWLWQTMHQRFEKLHGLDNIIWVCPVKYGRMFPGDDYIDIIGCDVYNNSNVSNLSAMLSADTLTLNRRMLALTECCFAPDPDILNRDNAMWLWAAPWGGKYLINEKGDMTGDYISINQLRKIYSHELTIARDELEIS